MRQLPQTRAFSRPLGATMLLALWLLAACSGTSSGTAQPGAGQSHLSPLPAPHLLTPDVRLRTVSGPPAGIHLSWTWVSDPAVAGYYLYRDSQVIPTPPPDETIDPTLRVNGGSPIPQPPTGPDVPFDDLFTPTVGTTYHYRVTTLDSSGNESYPSNEITYTVTGQHITNVAPLSGLYGDTLTITGDTFGTSNVATDSVLFAAALGGTVPGIITDWQPTQITVQIPIGAETGEITVAINGYAVQSSQTVVILNPVINSFNPVSVFVGQPLTVHGSGFGVSQGSSTISLAGQDLTAQVGSWDNNDITLTLPVGVSAGDMVVHAGHDSNPAPFSPRAEVLSTTPVTVGSGSDLTLNGRYFGSLSGAVAASAGVTASVNTWSDTAISIHLTGPVGACTLTVEPAGAPLPGNDYAFTIATPLTVDLGGIVAGAVLRPASPPTLTVSTPPSAEKVELLLDGNPVDSSTTGPFTGLKLPLATTHNGLHQVSARATRGSEVVTSTPLQVSIISLDGDINGDGTVNSLDRDALLLVLGLTSADSGYRAWYDTDGDGVITEADLSRIGYNFGKHD